MSATKERKNQTQFYLTTKEDSQGRVWRIDRRPLNGQGKGKGEITKDLSCILRMQKGVSWPAGSRREADFYFLVFEFLFSSGFPEHHTALD